MVVSPVHSKEKEKIDPSKPIRLNRCKSYTYDLDVRVLRSFGHPPVSFVPGKRAREERVGRHPVGGVMLIPPGLRDGEVEVRDVSSNGGGGEQETASTGTHEQHLQLWMDGWMGGEVAWLDAW